MQIHIEICTSTEHIFISTVLLSHKDGCNGEYVGKYVPDTQGVVLSCSQCGAEHIVELQDSSFVNDLEE